MVVFRLPKIYNVKDAQGITYVIVFVSALEQLKAEKLKDGIYRP